MIFKIENDVISEETVGNSNLIVSFFEQFFMHKFSFSIKNQGK
jgi:hypothetical protein